MMAPLTDRETFGLFLFALLATWSLATIIVKAISKRSESVFDDEAGIRDRANYMDYLTAHRDGLSWVAAPATALNTYPVDDTNKVEVESITEVTPIREVDTRTHRPTVTHPSLRLIKGDPQD